MIIYFFRTNAIEQFSATVTNNLANGSLILDYGDGRVNTVYFIGGDMVNYLISYDCVECNTYGDQGSEWYLQKKKTIFSIIQNIRTVSYRSKVLNDA
jgi:hypothetical protein